ILIVRVPRSWLALHMVTFQEHSRFYTRHTAGRYVMDVQEIRTAFLLSEELPEKVRRFRDERLARIVAGETPLVLPEGPRTVLHILPLSAFTRSTHIEVPLLVNMLAALEPMSAASWGGRFNADGYVVSAVGPHVTYVQVMRSGA